LGADGVEIERKFVLAAPPAPEVLDAFGEPLHMDQRYLRSPRAGLTRRVRAVSTPGSSRFFYTEKEPLPRVGPASSGAVVRAEREEEISAGRYRELCREADPDYRVVVKDRWRIPVDDLVFELDHVREPVELWVLEVELDDPDVPVVVPPEFGAVREDPACSMAALARGTYPTSGPRDV
jgi:CYTH domain-containing protein